MTGQLDHLQTRLSPLPAGRVSCRTRSAQGRRRRGAAAYEFLANAWTVVADDFEHKLKGDAKHTKHN